MATKCTSIQKSLGWCQGTPELPGVKRRIYYLAKSLIVAFPQLPRDELGRPRRLSSTALSLSPPMPNGDISTYSPTSRS